jgi:hypothetical protein
MAANRPFTALRINVSKTPAKRPDYLLTITSFFCCAGLQILTTADRNGRYDVSLN